MAQYRLHFAHTSGHQLYLTLQQFDLAVHSAELRVHPDSVSEHPSNSSRIANSLAILRLSHIRNSGRDMGVGRVNALDAVAFTARADNLATTFQLASLALIAAYTLDISCGFPERQG